MGPMDDFYKDRCPACGGTGVRCDPLPIDSSGALLNCATCFGDGVVFKPATPTGRCPGCGVDVFTAYGKCRVCDRVR